MNQSNYLMEGDEESVRLDLKTDPEVVKKQARWAGLKTGMRVADLGCGSGKTTFHLNEIVGSTGSTVGVDIARQRLDYAENHYRHERIEYVCADIRKPLNDLGMFDFIWMRFILEYYRKDSFEIVKNISKVLKPGGILCLIDLDNNCLRHFGLSERLEKYLIQLMQMMETEFNFDPYVGIKLYSYLYDLNYQEILVDVAPHNLIYGKLKEIDKFNWTQKLEIAAKNSGCQFEDYPDGYKGFFKEFIDYFTDRRRFSYTPLVSCRGRKPRS